MARIPCVIGNWKMYKTAREATDYIDSLNPLIEGCSAKLFLAVPYTSIAPASQCAKLTKIAVGAQNMHDVREGAFTGEIASLMLKEAGASFVILGHSERRTLFGETNELIHKKVVRALKDDLLPVLCIGENAQERKEGKTHEALKEQLVSALAEIPKEDAEKVIVAYEPVWAIGTGETATPAIAQEAHFYIRSVLRDLFGEKTGDLIPILYGGSVKPNNVHLLMQESDIDGVLVGGASLDPKTFAAIAMQCTSIERTE